MGLLLTGANRDTYVGRPRKSKLQKLDNAAHTLLIFSPLFFSVCVLTRALCDEGSVTKSIGRWAAPQTLLGSFRRSPDLTPLAISRDLTIFQIKSQIFLTKSQIEYNMFQIKSLHFKSKRQNGSYCDLNPNRD